MTMYGVKRTSNINYDVSFNIHDSHFPIQLKQTFSIRITARYIHNS